MCSTYREGARVDMTDVIKVLTERKDFLVPYSFTAAPLDPETCPEDKADVVYEYTLVLRSRRKA